jgi:hypothetical protein
MFGMFVDIFKAFLFVTAESPRSRGSNVITHRALGRDWDGIS